ncbi:MAG: hypothetical protein AB8U20_02650 [Rickettsiales endosymbiont of Dermacentor nuttalli]
MNSRSKFSVFPYNVLIMAKIIIINACFTDHMIQRKGYIKICFMAPIQSVKSVQIISNDNKLAELTKSCYMLMLDQTALY